MSNLAGAYSTVLYPAADDATFDMEYYLNVHMPLCAQVWAPHGLQSWQVIRFGTHPDGSNPPYSVQAILHWPDARDLDIVQAESSNVIFDDVPKFSNKLPIFMVGMWIGKS